eukprot:2995854-Pleurochrysis_carterae.AAC.1
MNFDHPVNDLIRGKFACDDVQRLAAATQGCRVTVPPPSERAIQFLSQCVILAKSMQLAVLVP